MHTCTISLNQTHLSNNCFSFLFPSTAVCLWNSYASFPHLSLEACLSGFPGGSDVNNLPAMQETWVQSLGRRSHGEGNGNPLQYSGLKNPMDRGTWQATVFGVRKELDATERLKTTTGLCSKYCSTCIILSKQAFRVLRVLWILSLIEYNQIYFFR